jgi:hypothetical protein
LLSTATAVAVPNGHVDTVVAAHQNLIFFLLKINFFLYVLDRFDALILKMILKK